MLYDKEFLLKLDKCKNKTVYARITALKFNESPIETIEGRVTGGSINLDGASAMRRTCSLTMVAQDFNYSDYYWGLNTKFKLEIGLQNEIDPLMPDIIWFNQGIYLITGFNTSRNSNNFTISINGKDKMCLLNGEVGGSLESSVDFGVIEEESADGVWEIRRVPIPDIIRNAVHTYAGEPYWNIVINDLDTYGLELLEYRYDTPMYLWRLKEDNVYRNALIENRDRKVYKSLSAEGTWTTDSSDWCYLEDLTYAHLDLMVDGMTGSTEPWPVKLDSLDAEPVILAKIEYGQTAGYRTTDLTYAGDLIANVGESITSVLDKIKNMLVEFEYFYDVNGQFVFQKKKSFTSTMWSPTAKDEYGNSAVTESLMLSSATAYTFSGGELITAFNNNPNLLNLRNDYSIWGERKGISGAAIPVHMRYAIDIKPTSYTTIEVDYGYYEYNEDGSNKLDDDGNPVFHQGRDFDVIDAYNQKYGTKQKGQSSVTYSVEAGHEWREIIYQMAKDYYKYNHLDDFELRIIKHNPQYPTGQTGYESYYIDLQGFWRELYYPTLREEIEELELRVGTDGKGGTLATDLADEEAAAEAYEQTVVSLNEQLDSGKDEDGIVLDTEELQNLYTQFIEAQNNWEKSKNKVLRLQSEQKEKGAKLTDKRDELKNYYYDDYDKDGKVIGNYDGYMGEEPTGNPAKRYWHRNVFEHPELLNFWFDFLDTEGDYNEDGSARRKGELRQFNVQSMGSRSKAINDTAVKSIYFRETPAVIFQAPGATFDVLEGYKYIQVPDANIDAMFSISSQGKSAKERLDELIYQHGYCIESATITAIPVYYLEPNVRIYIHDEDTGLDGEYVVSKITLPLAYNGTMSITATKAAESLY